MKINIFPRYFYGISTIFLLCFYFVSLANATTFSISPPLFRVSLTPGETWKSTVRISQTGETPKKFYVETANLLVKSGGIQNDEGFVPIFEKDSTIKANSLSGWIDLTEINGNTIKINALGFYDIPFAIHIPKDAPPGDHYAAILVGEQPLEQKQESQISTSATFTAQLFIRVAGDVIERGTLREFSITKSMFRDPKEIAMQLKIENTGNVHLRPEGSVTISNWWGDERIKIDLRNIGVILPTQFKTIFVTAPEFTKGWLDAGYYVATLRLALNDTQYLHRNVSFFILPSKETILFVDFISIILLTAFFGTRWYIRKKIK